MTSSLKKMFGRDKDSGNTSSSRSKSRGRSDRQPDQTNLASYYADRRMAQSDNEQDNSNDQSYNRSRRSSYRSPSPQQQQQYDNNSQQQQQNDNQYRSQQQQEQSYQEQQQQDDQHLQSYLPSHSNNSSISDFIPYSLAALQSNGTFNRLAQAQTSFLTVDYGCAQGQNSLPFVRQLLQQLTEHELLTPGSSTSQQHGSDQQHQQQGQSSGSKSLTQKIKSALHISKTNNDNNNNDEQQYSEQQQQQDQRTTTDDAIDVIVVHEDQLGNGFDSLFDAIDGLNANDSKQQQQSSLKRYGYQMPHSSSSVYTLASSTSFFEQVLPSNSVSFGFTTACWHWLSELPCNLTNTFHSIYAAGEEKQQWQQHAARDWSTLIGHRARELQAGGILLISLYCADDNGQCGGFERVHEAIDKVLESMIRDQILTIEELDGSSCPMYYRRKDEYLDAQLLQANNLQVLHSEERQLQNPLYEQHHHDTERFAAEFTQWCRTWSQNTFLNAFSGGDEDEKVAKVEELYSRLEQYVYNHPQEMNGTPLVAYVVLQKGGIEEYEQRLQRSTAVGSNHGSAQLQQNDAAPVLGQDAIGLSAITGGSAIAQKVAEDQNIALPLHERSTPRGERHSVGNNQLPSAVPLPPQVQARAVSNNEVEYSLSDIMHIVLDGVLRAGEELEAGYFTKRKSHNDLKLAKQRCAQVLIECLMHAFRSCRIITDDSTDVEITEHLTFLIDPIGGSNNWLHDSPFCSISVGVLANKTLIAGVVHAPILNTTYHAVVGQGAYVSSFRLLREGERAPNTNSNSGDNDATSYTSAGYTQMSRHQIHVSDVKSLDHALIRTEIHASEDDNDLQQTLQHLYALLSSKTQAVRMIGCTPLNLCSVAMGSSDCYYQMEHPNQMLRMSGDHQNIPFACIIAGGTVILKEAGGIIVNHTNQANDISFFSLFSGNIIGCNTREIASSLLDVLNSPMGHQRIQEDHQHDDDMIIHQQPAASAPTPTQSRNASRRSSLQAPQSQQYNDNVPVAPVGKSNNAPSTGSSELDNVLHQNNQQMAQQRQQQQQQPPQYYNDNTSRNSSRRNSSSRRSAPALPSTAAPSGLPFTQKEQQAYLNRLNPQYSQQQSQYSQQSQQQRPSRDQQLRKSFFGN